MTTDARTPRLRDDMTPEQDVAFTRWQREPVDLGSGKGHQVRLLRDCFLAGWHAAVLDTEGDRPEPDMTTATMLDLYRWSIRTGCETELNQRADMELRKRGYRFDASQARWIADTEGDASPAPRPETGPMQFGDDWPGLFIRGDNAFGYSLALNTAIDATKDPLTLAQLRSLRRLLVGCDVRNSPEVQHARIVPLPDPPVQP